MFTNEDISRYYDLSEVHYRRIWKLDRSRSLHYGYWDKSTKNFHEALLNINRVLAEKVSITDADNLLDAGCGVGGSSLWLAREKKCRVTGISLNQRQVDKANRLANEMNLQQLVSFHVRDYSDTQYADESFDVIWGIESVCYADEKANFLKEAFRILKPGGRLIIADFFKADGLDAKQLGAVKEWANGWAINDFASNGEFYSKSIIAGFKDIEFTDITQAILPSAKKLYLSFFPGIVGSWLYRMINPEATSLGKANVMNAYRQYKTLRKGLWTYQIVKAVKENQHTTKAKRDEIVG